jgi:cyanophycin synthetase
MKIKVLQGCTLESEHTTVVIECEKAETSLLERFKALHPIFMSSYTIEDERMLKIQTDIPHLWKNPEFVQQIEDLATGKKTYQEAEETMMEQAKLLLGSMTTIPILSAAHALGYETIQFYVNEGSLLKKGWNLDYCIGIGQEQQLIHSASSSKDSQTAQKTQRDKILTNQYLEEMGIPVAGWAPVETKAELPSVAEKLGFPLVMKPAGLTGGHGVQIGMRSIEELEEAWDRIHYYFEHEMKFPEAKAAWQKKILVQQVLKGNDYRLLVIDGNLEIATHRKQAQVIGDGTSTVEQLIEKENQNPARDIRLPTHTLKPIVIDEDLKKVLAKQQLSLSYVPKKDETVRVRDVASMSQGGITVDVTDTLCPQIRYLAQSIARSIHAHVLGVDVLCQDITKPLTLENGGIIEMNTMPEMYLNTFPVMGTQYPEVNGKMVQALMKSAGHTDTVVVMGQISDDKITDVLEKELPNHGRIGTLHAGTYSINGQPIHTSLTTHEGVLCIKKNASLQTIVLHYDTLEEVIENGFGFNTIDLFVSTNNALTEQGPLVKQYQDIGLIHKLITA